MVHGNKDFNGRLIALIKAHPVLWNRNDLQYRSSRNRKEQNLIGAWEQIASELGEGITADECCAKWGNLRCNYSRYLRNVSIGNPSKFYLSEEMEFLKPHMDVKLLNTTGNDSEENETGQMEQEDSESGGESGIASIRQCKHMLVDSRNTDAVFLLSLLPEMGRMNPVQKRMFKQGALELSQLILD
uniref:Putative alcohol dehydrogenase transcription factor myb/sant-like protein n=1 Tax=Culex tarsalis TaxID=7177 RepID=A0A1Q3F7F4_CULTA